MDIKRGIDKAVAKVVESLKNQAQVVGDDLNKIEQVARISANNDEEIGKLIATAMEKVKKEGVITVEEANRITSYNVCYTKLLRGRPDLADSSRIGRMSFIVEIFLS